MPDLVASDVTITIDKQSHIGRHGRLVSGSIALGDGAKTYPTNGVPLDYSKLGAKQGICQEFMPLGASSTGLVPKWDPVNNTLRLFESGAGSGSLDSISGGTPAGTNTTSSVSPKFEPDRNLIVKPVITLTHNADPPTNLAATAIFLLEASGQGSNNLAYLESTTDGDASILGETANGSVGGVAASCRFWIADNDSPTGIRIYVNEAMSDRLEFVSPTATDAYIVMPFEAAAGGPPGCAVAVKVYHSATAATGKDLYFDDNGLADAQLIFNDAGTSGGVVPAADIIPLVPAYMENAGDPLGLAAAQTFSGNALAGHTHTFTGSGETGMAELDGGADAPSAMTLRFEAIVR